MFSLKKEVDFLCLKVFFLRTASAT